jgi:hypothetical protein
MRGHSLASIQVSEQNPARRRQFSRSFCFPRISSDSETSRQTPKKCSSESVRVGARPRLAHLSGSGKNRPILPGSVTDAGRCARFWVVPERLWPAGLKTRLYKKLTYASDVASAIGSGGSLDPPASTRSARFVMNDLQSAMVSIPVNVISTLPTPCGACRPAAARSARCDRKPGR